MKLVTMRDSKSRAERLESSSLSSGSMRRFSTDVKLRAYIVGLALGDGNLSNPNGRAVRLRITCDKKYPKLLTHICGSVHKLLPDNKVSRINREGAVDVSGYSNRWEALLGWEARAGSKFKQKVSIPVWIKKDRVLQRECLRGLLQTDGSIYLDRKYKMVNFVSEIPSLALDVYALIKDLGYKISMQRFLNEFGKVKFTIRIATKTEAFLKDTNLWKK